MAAVINIIYTFLMLKVSEIFKLKTSLDKTIPTRGPMTPFSRAFTHTSHGLHQQIEFVQLPWR